jgi:hypothetical protein
VLFKWLGKGGGTTAGGTRAPKAARTDTAYLGFRGMGVDAKRDCWVETRERENAARRARHQTRKGRRRS